MDREEARLEKLLREHGRRSGSSGESFEQLARQLTEQHIVHDLLRRSKGGRPEQRIRVLAGVTLGAARTELDQLVVRLPRGGPGPVEVLAAVEVKRNPNDLAHGFQQRQENLAWLTGAADGPDPELYRTGHFRSGRFDRPAVHHEQGETFVFDRSSFRRFRRDPTTGLFLDRLYFITRAGPLWGVSAAALARISFRVATDERSEPDSEAYLRRFLDWCRALAGPCETTDVIRMYAAAPQLARQILVVDR